MIIRKVIVRITDLNDNAPVFTPAHKDLSLSESAALNHVFPLSAAYDPDSPVNGVSRYDLIGGGDTFTLQVHTNQDGSKDLRLVLLAPLDREKVDIYHLQARFLFIINSVMTLHDFVCRQPSETFT